MVEYNCRIQHIDNLIEVLMLQGLIDGYIFIDFVDLVKGLEYLSLGSPFGFNQKPPGKVTVFHRFGKFHQLLKQESMAGEGAVSKDN